MTALWIRTVGSTAPWFDPCETPHPALTIRGIEVDEKIAPLVEGLWSVGIETGGSCQGDARIYRALLRTMPNLSHGLPAAASVTLLNLSDALRVHAAIDAQHQGRRLSRPTLTTQDGEVVHVQFRPELLDAGDFVDAVVGRLMTSSGRL